MLGRNLNPLAKENMDMVSEADESVHVEEFVSDLDYFHKEQNMISSDRRHERIKTKETVARNNRPKPLNGEGGIDLFQRNGSHLNTPHF